MAPNAVITGNAGVQATVEAKGSTANSTWYIAPMALSKLTVTGPPAVDGSVITAETDVGGGVTAPVT